MEKKGEVHQLQIIRTYTQLLAIAKSHASSILNKETHLLKTNRQNSMQNSANYGAESKQGSKCSEWPTHLFVVFGIEHSQCHGETKDFQVLFLFNLDTLLTLACTLRNWPYICDMSKLRMTGA